MAKKLSTLFNNTDYITADYVNAVLKNLTWQNKVVGIHTNNDWPSAPYQGQRYIAGKNFSKWNKNDIYEYADREWIQIPAKTGMSVYSEEHQSILVFVDTQWINVGNLVDHNSLSNSQGGKKNEKFHLSNEDYKNLTGEVPSFVDLTLSSPSSIYNDLDHNELKNYDENQHIDWTKSSGSNIHDDNIVGSSITQHENKITHNNLSGIKGSSQGYHLLENAYKNLSQQNQKVRKDSSPHFHSISIDKEIGYGPDEVIRKSYFDKLVKSSLIWNPSAEGFRNPNEFDRTGEYIGETFISSENGEFWKKGYIYRWSGVEWEEHKPKNGYIFIVEEMDGLYVFSEKWKPAELVYQHDNLYGINGGKEGEYYHLSKEDYDNLNSRAPIFYDLTVTNPKLLYNSIDHNKLKNYNRDQHIDWTITGNDRIHISRVPEGASSKIFIISINEWNTDGYKEVNHNLNIEFPHITCWNSDTNEIIYPDITVLDTNNIKIYSQNNINMAIRIG